MKKILVPLLTITLLFTACTPYVRVGVSTDYAAAIMVDGQIYNKSITTMDLGDSEPNGYTTSYTNEYPDEDGECNFNREVGMPYVFVEDGLAIFYENQWFLCSP